MSAKSKKAFSYLLFILLLLVLLVSNPFSPGSYIWMRRLLVIAVMLISARIFLQRPFKILRVGAGLLTLLFLLSEAILMNLPITFGPGDSLGSKIWFSRYWQPLNSLGYRDAEPSASDTTKTNILLIGDSFTAAQGIEKTDDRYGEVMGKELGPAFKIWNAGECGAGPEKEYRNLNTYPFRADIVVLQWFVNDIEDAASAAGKIFRHPAAQGWKMSLRRAMRCSYTLDLISTLITFSAESGYDKWLDTLYQDPAVLTAHFTQLSRIQEWCSSHHCRLIVMPCPFLWDPATSSSYLHPIQTYLKSSGIETFDPEAGILSLPRRERIVNPLDHHPGKALHALWGKSLAKQILKY